MQLTGAEAVVKCLVEQGVDTVFGYPGGQIMPLYDALYDSPLRHILTVHEQGAVHAADGYARVSGRVGVCIATSGPGATNLVTGLAAAYLDSVPLVAITGQVPIGMLGRDSFQEVDITGITMSVTKHNFLVKNAARIPEILRLAFRIARSGRPGPVLVDLPRDVQQAQLTYYPAEQAAAKPAVRDGKTDDALRRATAAIAAARRPVMVVGGGVIRGQASREATLLAEKLGLPVVSTLMGLGALPSTHPQWLGLTGMHGHVAANRTVHEADLVIAVGSRFSDRVTGDPKRYPAGKTFIHLDIDRSEIGKNIASHIALIGELGPLLTELAARAAAGDTAPWNAAVVAWRAENTSDYQTGTLNAPWIMREISRHAAGRPVVFATDVGQHQMWAAQHLAVDAPGTWLTSGGLGCMGFGLPAALGAQVAAPGSRVVLVAGDGGFKMTGMELYTLTAYNLPVIAVILDNRCLGMVRQWQQLFYRQRYSASLAPRELDFAAFAAVCGVPGRRVATPAEFTAAFAAAWRSGGPAIIAADIGTEDIVTPMIAPGAAINEFVNVK
jgi:acetolactate synthase-1/2/3 large subunit